MLIILHIPETKKININNCLSENKCKTTEENITNLALRSKLHEPFC